MKSFFKNLLASTLGAFIAMGLVSVLGVVVLAGVATVMLSSASSTVTVMPNSILSLKLDKPIVDRTNNNPFSRIETLSLAGSGSIGLNVLLRGIEAAAEDGNIKGIYLDASNLQAGLATIEELRNALLRFRESGKFVIAYADVYGQGAYYLASAADNVYLHPTGIVDWRGLGGSSLFFKGALDKLGVEVEIFRHGKFKGAVEPFMYEKMSAENKEQILTYANSIWQHWQRGIEAQRKISVANLQDIAERLLLRDAESCVQLSFVDDLKYKDQVIAELSALSLQTDEAPTVLNILDYAATLKPHAPKAKSELAVLYAEGDVLMDGKSGIVGNDLAHEIRQLRKDSAVRAVVLRINSPGGSALASDIVWREVDLLRQTKPVVVSMGDVAASGGYYIACAATKIVAGPTTITGSIGVFSLLVNAEKAAKNKLGITADAALTAPYADLGSIFRPMSLAERHYLQHSVETIYVTFVEHVANGRGMKVAAVDEVGQGRVWSGADAQRIKLVDELGGLQRAIDLAADLASLIDYRTVEYPLEKNSLTIIMETLGEVKARALASPAQAVLDAEPFASLRRQHGNAQARLPYDITLQ